MKEGALKDFAKGMVQVSRNLGYLSGHLGKRVVDRKQSFTQAGYEKTWSIDLAKHKEYYRVPRLLVLNNRFTSVTTLELDYHLVKTHHDGIRRYAKAPASGPMKILEIGAGFGRILFPISSLFPEAECYGVEYSHQGPETARHYPKEFSDEIRTVAQRIGPCAEPKAAQFIQGDGKALPFPDKSMDVCYTNLVLEQIPNPTDHEAFLREAKRVSRGICCFLEPWAEAQNILTMGYLKYVDYFHEKSSILSRLGFKNVRVTLLPFHPNLKFKYAYVVADAG